MGILRLWSGYSKAMVRGHSKAMVRGHSKAMVRGHSSYGQGAF